MRYAVWIVSVLVFLSAVRMETAAEKRPPPAVSIAQHVPPTVKTPPAPAADQDKPEPSGTFDEARQAFDKAMNIQQPEAREQALREVAERYKSTVYGEFARQEQEKLQAQRQANEQQEKDRRKQQFEKEAQTAYQDAQGREERLKVVAARYKGTVYGDRARKDLDKFGSERRQAPKQSEVPAAVGSGAAQDVRPLKVKDTFFDCHGCPEMVVVPAGEFPMGSPETEAGRFKDEGPQRKVTIAGPFAVGKFEVTREQFEMFVAETQYAVADTCFTYERKRVDKRPGRSFRNPGFEQGGTHPVVCINWPEAQAYVKWLSEKTGKPYRLLTEAEWEYAARAGTTSRFYFGDAAARLCEYANTADRSTTIGAKGAKNTACSDGVGNTTAEVGQYKANNFGLHDVHGNVSEWVEDCWIAHYTGAPDDGSARTTGNCNDRVLRGGSWRSNPSSARSATRHKYLIITRYDIIGFRVARALEPAK